MKIRSQAHIWLLFLAASLLLSSCDATDPASVDDELPRIENSIIDLGLPWKTAEPEQVDMLEDRLTTAVAEAGQIDRLRSLLVVRNGRLVTERYFGGADEATLHDVRSVTKSVVGTLTGIAHASGLLPDLDAPITDYIDDEIAEVRAEHSLITVRHLLTMTSGVEWVESGSTGYVDWINSADPVQYFFDKPLAATPGTQFAYNSAAVHVLGLVVGQAVAESLPDYADNALFGPIGIDVADWENMMGTSVNGGAGLDLEARDLARFGQLWLQRGRSGDTQILPETWIDDSLENVYPPQGSFGPLNGISYGFLWWTEAGQVEPAYLAWGYGGQFVYVVPDLNLVVVATTDWRGVIDVNPLEQDVLDVIVRHVVPAARLGSASKKMADDSMAPSPFARRVRPAA
ncbi:MAG: serine hydrolase [Rhodothermales bacterium]|nr:serine hydrolase [Rhodothermales bacterium]